MTDAAEQYAEELFADMATPEIPADEVEPPEPEGAEPEPAPEFYPGSRHQIPPKVEDRKPSPPEKPWDRNPKLKKVKGVEKEFFSIGALAEAINRKPVTIRSWEAKGIIPKARYRTGGSVERRLYTREQVEGLIRLCAKHDILDFSARPDRIPPEFTADAVSLWAETGPSS